MPNFIKKTDISSILRPNVHLTKKYSQMPTWESELWTSRYRKFARYRVSSSWTISSPIATINGHFFNFDAFCGITRTIERKKNKIRFYNIYDGKHKTAENNCTYFISFVVADVADVVQRVRPTGGQLQTAYLTQVHQTGISPTYY